MASLSFFSCSVLQYKNYHNITRKIDIHKPIYPSKSTSDIVTAKATAVVQPFARRSANYAPTLWTFDHIQSLSSEYTGEYYKARANSLKDTVKKMLVSKVGDPLSSLELVDDLQRLGISYHFQEEIRNLLEMIYCSYYKPHDQWDNLGLNLKALGFRLLRQHGFQVPQEIFHNFKSKIQNLKPQELLENTIGMLNLYEASYHSLEEESLLDDARDFSATFLKENQDRFDENISSLVSHALEFPLHWRVPRIEAKWFIHAYEKRSDMNPILLELSKLDFDMVQAVHIEDLKHASRWWSNTRWDSKLSFSRDRVVVNFLWTIGFGYLPQYTLGRRTLAKVNSMITTIDDVYDVYGNLDELEQFTRVIERWDINAAEELPDYMKICFLGFHNTVNEIAYDTMADTGFFILPYLKKAWADLCNAYLVEARWYYGGYQPTLKEYLDNGWVSISGPVILMNATFLTSVGTTNEVFQCMEGLEKIVHYSSRILRLADDLGTSEDEMVKGDISKSIQCYMHESGATEEEARMHIKELILETWKKLNKERARANSQFSREFVEYATNVARTAQFIYSEGDGHGRPDIIQSHISALLFNPIQRTI
ncbi:putative R-linalool synthase [Helianthus annuus]|uniref:germacrene-A synthase n=1 Tax=Helianthus annuus TaxID=4232 RepID=A0A251SFY7_HELAN|nr:R-linalool synthase QH1, chloroplastic [Helianthus annuus]KAF5767606.1 putative R-linalool synthase [Helianthus annuus]KAJ0463124.1 putative R-linalool synthase [Helianthus annuus]KAJ0466953.1 putative R-linalool synthase [Helianthus annuus]KAJ0484492.1 putative R-linalool synthase [Helianthus annuus]KAJ0655049.1 putative R-linalool synthase [Helianthus annuus]